MMAPKRMMGFKEGHLDLREWRWPEAGSTVSGSGCDRSQQSCSRWGGMLIREWCLDLYDSQTVAELDRCIQCGYRVDGLLLRNRLHPPTKRRTVKR